MKPVIVSHPDYRRFLNGVGGIIRMQLAEAIDLNGSVCGHNAITVIPGIKRESAVIILSSALILSSEYTIWGLSLSLT